ncbi:hypothetical protein [Methanohalophilus sp.]
MRKKDANFLSNQEGVSVVLGTLLLILITITAASGLALMVSSAQKEMMERESHISAVENEQLEIIDIKPYGNTNTWETINVTILNMNIDSSRVNSIALNNNYIMNYLKIESNGEIEYNSEYTDYPVIYNLENRPRIPAKKSNVFMLQSEDIVVNTSDYLGTSKWSNMSKNYTLKLLNHPSLADYPFDCNVEVYNETNLIKNTGNYSINPDATITFLGRNYTFNHYNDTSLYNDSNNISSYQGPVYNNTNYTICYTSIFETYRGSYEPEKSETLKFEVMTSLINIFDKTYNPPLPFAETYIRTEERVNQTGVHKFEDYLVLDASSSFDEDGNIIKYKWAIWNDGGLVYDYNLTGKIVRPTKIEPYENLTIDLEVIDDDRMTGKLSQHAGNITLP